ncbi:alpha-1,2-fucosyltransferase [Flavobacterium sp. FlaQc-47]|uniref:alpha-1,2-fucosyltransferase n=1 Tax=Flavobacterium sp. FlaQc-47 TaxID=3374180 RepID=UPI0037569520
MITYSKIGKKGNLGNQLFQIASTIGLGVKNNLEFSFLDWKYQYCFKNKLPRLDLDFSNFEPIDEKEYNYHDWNLKDKDYDISGWLQSEKYFDKALTKFYFEFSESLIDSLKTKYQEAFKKRTLLISIRRGDFVNHPDYFQLSIKYYLNSLVRFFPDWESCNLIILSDDIRYCKFHFSFLENAFFGDGLNEVEQLCLGTLCDDFILSNSTFSWWSGWLGEKEDSKVIRPFKNLDGLKSVELNDKDYFPERWMQYNHMNDRLALENVIFQIKSAQNNAIIKNYILNYFEVKVVFEKAEAGILDKIYYLNNHYFLPPILIYVSYLKLNKSKLVINNLIEIFKLSQQLNQKELLEQNDFGLFSSVFSFENFKIQFKIDEPEIYLKNNTLSVDNLNLQNEITINFSGGKFAVIGGYQYSFKRLIKNSTNAAKRSIKKMLLIKKYGK